MSQRLPLQGIRVIEFCHVVMGPTCGLVLADLGAVDFLKGDIEGSEFALFDHCRPWICQVHYIAMEVPHDCGDNQALQRRLGDQGLVVRHEGEHRDLGYPKPSGSDRQ